MRKRLSSERAQSAPYQRGIRVITVGLPNHRMNKSRGITVEFLVTISDSYEKNSVCSSYACCWHICSSAGEGTGSIG
jgi:hypothetical protein